MADFCPECARYLGLPEADIKADSGSIIVDVCDGCGPGWFDEHGKRVAEDEKAPTGVPEQWA